MTRESGDVRSRRASPVLCNPNEKKENKVTLYGATVNASQNLIEHQKEGVCAAPMDAHIMTRT